MATRTTMNISLPPALKAWIDKQVVSGGYGTASEFMRDLVRESKRRARARREIEDAIEVGLNSGPPRVMTPQGWETLRREGRARADKLRRERARTTRRRKSA